MSGIDTAGMTIEQVEAALRLLHAKAESAERLLAFGASEIELANNAEDEA